MMRLQISQIQSYTSKLVRVLPRKRTTEDTAIQKLRYTIMLDKYREKEKKKVYHRNWLTKL